MTETYLEWETGKRQLWVPDGFEAKIERHYKSMLRRMQVQTWPSRIPESLSDKETCEVFAFHNKFARILMRDIKKYTEFHSGCYGILTGEWFEQYACLLSELPTPPPEKWTRDFYMEQMESLFENAVETITEIQGAEVLNSQIAEAAFSICSPIMELLDRWDTRYDIYSNRLYEGDQLEYCNECGEHWPKDDENGVSLGTTDEYVEMCPFCHAIILIE